MPISHTLEEMINKYTAKMNPTQVGTNYGNARTVAINRYMQGTYEYFASMPKIANVLSNLGVPAGVWGIYYAFVFKLTKYNIKHSGATLNDIVTALQQEFVTLGADPAVLAQLANMVVG